MRYCQLWAGRPLKYYFRPQRHKILEKYGVRIIGASVESIDMAEDRELFKNAMSEIGLETPMHLLLIILKKP
ncbi:MAG: hypothetical protein Ct9H90mP18_04110 [Gammaproteobacteria bacterium]|nr:MAG: hypothetical protein Ct9H90mP18_04110 [Gammaproteobacteria bacterium]